MAPASQVPGQQGRTRGRHQCRAASNLLRDILLRWHCHPPTAPSSACCSPPSQGAAAAAQGGRSPGSDRPQACSCLLLAEAVIRAEGHLRALCSAREQGVPGCGRGGAVCCWTQGRACLCRGVADEADGGCVRERRQAGWGPSSPSPSRRAKGGHLAVGKLRLGGRAQG